MARRDYSGGAVSTVLSADITNASLSITIDSATGWPTGGVNGEFFITIDPGLPNEERILVASRSGTTLTVANVSKRGVDDTAAVGHTGGQAIVQHTFSATDADEANRHLNDTTIDEHTQYMRADGVRHDTTARHSAGTVVPTGVPVATGTALAEGSGTQLARFNHVHTIGVGSIDNTNKFA